MEVPGLIGRIDRYRRQHGIARTALFLWRRLLREWPHVVYERNLDTTLAAVEEWREDERLLVIGPDNVGAEATPELVAALGPEAEENLQGVRNGNWLFVVLRGSELLHCGYVMFGSRQTRVLGEKSSPPLIGCCYTAPAARGRGLYRNALKAQMLRLREQGYRRVIIETHPGNIASRKAIEAAGFRLLREGSSWILLNRLVLQTSREPRRPARLLLA